MGVVFLLHSAAWGIAHVAAGVGRLPHRRRGRAAHRRVLGLLGKKSLETAQPAPERAIDQAQQTIAAIKEPFGDSDAVDATPRCPPHPAATAGLRHGGAGIRADGTAAGAPTPSA